MKSKQWLGIGALSLVLFLLLAANVINGTMQGFNDMVYSHVAAWITPARTGFMIFISNVGQWFVYVPVALLFLIIPKSRITIGLPVALAISVSALLNFILKQIFAAARPDIYRLVSESGYGFPSGHAMNGTVFIGLCAYLFIRYSYKRPLKIVVFSLSVLFMLLMGVSRVYLGVHYATDILGGYLAGGVVLTTAICIVNKKNPIQK